ncbi:E3 ubiquitin-protein ligase TTC3-like [Hordeum vulgare subsp. vulgare]|uniref:E3 ubiquitin-protein ligase TTC3-like n=1 Tax=Hordeum vulgare subsp. vulgare TaxID=112509 RepID=UPI000B4769AA|nr:E3 ubiquitin-protein ligase TTC3-like [Hordeum vulgare subsp. vulgare]
MAGMLPGVECARRRRMWQGGGAGADQAAAGTRRLSFCLYAAGHGAAHAVGTGSSGNKRSGLMDGWALDSNAREAKERLDQKLKSKSNGPDAVIKRHHSTGSIKVSRANGGGSSAAVATGVQREVYSKKGVMRRLMRWSRLRWDAAEQAECAVCLDEFAAGDVLAHLPCGHRFHWGCALPWLEGAAAASHSCPFCRAKVDAGAHAAS